MIKNLTAAALVAVTLSVSSVPAFAQDPTALAMAIQERLSDEAAFGQVVAVPDGESVVLTGAVASEEERVMLEEMIAGMDGAGSVDNQVAIR